MPANSTVRPAIVRALATYAVACFVILQLLDIALEPLGLPVTAIRWTLLIMIVVAPFLVAGVAWRTRHQQSENPIAAGSSDHQTVFTIGQARLDTGRRLILFSGTQAEVQPKVFDLIEYLVRARDRVVSKDELFDNVWPNVVVTEASLTQSVKRARDLFRQNGFDDDVIRTVSRKGYQFNAPVDARNQQSADKSSLLPDVVLPTAVIGVMAAALVLLLWASGDEQPIPSDGDRAASSLVVLPFANLTPDQEFVYFSDGLTETLSTTMATVRNLRIIARGSAFSYRDEQVDYATIGSELGVAHIVEGSVQRDENDLRISARLIRAADGQQLWSQIYSRPFDDIFTLQDEVSRAVVSQMSGLLSASLEIPGIDEITASHTGSAESYRLLLLGRERMQNASNASLEEAEAAFRTALELSPDYPHAMVATASVLRIRATWGELPRASAFAEALALLRSALDLYPDFADAYVQLGEIQHRHLWDFDAAAESFSRALELNPGSANVRSAYSRFLSKAGEPERAIAEAEAALDLDPRSASAAASLAIRRMRAGRLDEARRVIDAMGEDHPDSADLPWLEANWHIQNGSYADALGWIALEELDYLRLSLSAIALFELDRTDQAQEALDELVRTDADGAAFQIAEVYAVWGDMNAAFEWLDSAFSKGDPGLAELYSTLNLKNLYMDSRFPPFAAKVGLPPVASL